MFWRIRFKIGSNRSDSDPDQKGSEENFFFVKHVLKGKIQLWVKYYLPKKLLKTELQSNDEHFWKKSRIYCTNHEHFLKNKDIF